MKSYFLTRGKEFVEVELLKNRPKYRQIKYKEGKKKGKTVHIHPDGVAWGKMYPRFFNSVKPPTDVFNYKGRILLQTEPEKNVVHLVPDLDDKFRFQFQTRDIVDGINGNECIMLSGGGGSGKTTTIEQIANRIKQPALRVNFSIETRISDFLGKIHVRNGQTFWTDGILPYCMKNGIWLILDEIDAADPAILMLLHPVLEDGGKLVLKENNGEVIAKHPNFRIFSTANSIGAMEDRAGAYAGTNKMNGAFIDRWTVIHWQPLPFKEELKVLKSKIGGLKHRWAVKMCEFARDVRSKKLNDYEFPADIFSTRQVLKWGKKTALHRSPFEGAKLAWLDKLPASEHDSISTILELYFGKGNRRAKTGIDVQEKERKPRKNKKK